MYRIAALAIFLTFSIPLAVLGQKANDTISSRMNAFACGTLPSPLTVDVQVLDNAKRFVQFRTRFIEALRASGSDAVRGAAAILTLDMRTEREFQRREGGELLELRAGQENTNIGAEGDVFFRGNIWSNSADSVLGGRKRDLGRLSLNQLRVTATVNDRKNGRCLWQGEVIHNLNGEHPDAATVRILPILAQSIGKTARNQAIDLDR
ncbi:MAG: hypothetical protein HOM58_10880 [Rhodospirillaceae bacterium]|jgi:hypothetical protein|nr:hypothetical protein [Rhodospirillaceae bacterium]